jgi:hypothetical protein
MGINGPFVVEATLSPGPRKQRPAIPNLAAVLKTHHVRGEGQSKQQARQQACADLLDLLLQVGACMQRACAAVLACMHMCLSIRV